MHKAEIVSPLEVIFSDVHQLIQNLDELDNMDVVMIRLPPIKRLSEISDASKFEKSDLYKLSAFVKLIANRLNEGAKLVILGEIRSICYVHAFLNGSMRFHDLIAVRLAKHSRSSQFLKNEHIDLALYTKGESRLNHVRVRIAYEYCAFCERTTKDYGGKKHLYDAYGTLMSDVWKDITISIDDPAPKEVVSRIKDLFSDGQNKKMLVIPIRVMHEIDDSALPKLDLKLAFPSIKRITKNQNVSSLRSALFNKDSLDVLAAMPDNSVDLVFADPPYNLSKKYTTYHDNLEIEEYFDWCDTWLEHLCRILKPGGSLLLLNIPQWSIRHFLYLQQRLTFQNWIVWEALSMPVRLIMPSHYTILFYTKGKSPRKFNYIPLDLCDIHTLTNMEDQYLYPMADNLCLRSSCISNRSKKGKNLKKELTDLWTDIHRLKHNSLRLDHPTQLPQKLMKRIIALLTDPNDIVLDCFNGIGTTTLCAHQLGRSYVGIEKDPSYYRIAQERHDLVRQGKDPFEKRKATPSTKNNNVPRVRTTEYKVPKKTLQLAVKKLAEKLGHIPSFEELKKYGEYPIQYYQEYFMNWSEVTAAVRNTGMKEKKDDYASLLDFVNSR